MNVLQWSDPALVASFNLPSQINDTFRQDRIAFRKDRIFSWGFLVQAAGAMRDGIWNQLSLFELVIEEIDSRKDPNQLTVSPDMVLTQMCL